MLVGLEQRRPGVDLDLEIDVGRLGVARDDLHHLVAHVPPSAGELVRGAQRGGSGEGARARCCEHGGRDGCGSKRYHAHPPQEARLYRKRPCRSTRRSPSMASSAPPGCRTTSRSGSSSSSATPKASLPPTSL